MSRQAWNTIIRSKSFYIRTYRTAVVWLMISLLVNLLLGLAIYYSYLNEPETDYYATSGITPPVKLKARDEPNKSSVPLLAPDPTNENDQRVIPQ